MMTKLSSLFLASSLIFFFTNFVHADEIDSIIGVWQTKSGSLIEIFKEKNTYQGRFLTLSEIAAKTYDSKEIYLKGIRLNSDAVTLNYIVWPPDKTLKEEVTPFQARVTAKLSSNGQTITGTYPSGVFKTTYRGKVFVSSIYKPDASGKTNPFELTRPKNIKFGLKNFQFPSPMDCPHRGGKPLFLPFAKFTSEGTIRTYLRRDFFHNFGNRRESEPPLRMKENHITAYFDYSDDEKTWSAVEKSVVTIARCQWNKEPAINDQGNGCYNGDESVPIDLDALMPNLFQHLNIGPQTRMFRFDLKTNTNVRHSAHQIKYKTPSFSKEDLLNILERKLNVAAERLFGVRLPFFQLSYVIEKETKKKPTEKLPLDELDFDYARAKKHLREDLLGMLGDGIFSVELHNLAETNQQFALSVSFSAVLKDNKRIRLGLKSAVLGSNATETEEPAINVLPRKNITLTFDSFEADDMEKDCRI